MTPPLRRIRTPRLRAPATPRGCTATNLDAKQDHQDRSDHGQEQNEDPEHYGPGCHSAGQVIGRVFDGSDEATCFVSELVPRPPEVGPCRRAFMDSNRGAHGPCVADPRHIDHTGSDNDVGACRTGCTGPQPCGPVANAVACSVHVVASMVRRMRQHSTKGCGCTNVIKSWASSHETR